MKCGIKINGNEGDDFLAGKQLLELVSHDPNLILLPKEYQDQNVSTEKIAEPTFWFSLVSAASGVMSMAKIIYDILHKKNVEITVLIDNRSIKLGKTFSKKEIRAILESTDKIKS